MYTIVTSCTKCRSSQLADGRLIGKIVKCAKCGSEFKCSKKLGPVLWAREVKAGESDSSFRKIATKVLFSYGLAVPVSHHGLFMEHLGGEMLLGSNHSAVIVLDGCQFPVSVSYFKNRRNEPSLHFRWKDSDAIALHIKKVMTRAYRHFIIEGNRDYLESESVSLEPSENKCAFKMTIYTAGANTPVQGNLFSASKASKKKIATSCLHDAEVRDMLSDLAT